MAEIPLIAEEPEILEEKEDYEDEVWESETLVGEILHVYYDAAPIKGWGLDKASVWRSETNTILRSKEAIIVDGTDYGYAYAYIYFNWTVDPAKPKTVSEFWNSEASWTKRTLNRKWCVCRTQNDAINFIELEREMMEEVGVQLYRH